MSIFSEDQVQRLDRGVDYLELSTRAMNVLKTARIRTVRDLVRWTPPRLMKVRMCGKKTLREIEVIVEETGFKLGMELPDEKISGVCLVELAVAFATRNKTFCTYTDPRDGRQTPNSGLVVHSISRRSYDSMVKYDVEAELLIQDGNVPITVVYDEEKKEGVIKRKPLDSVQ